jgi:hypothetical protein
MSKLCLSSVRGFALTMAAWGAISAPAQVRDKLDKYDVQVHGFIGAHRVPISGPCCRRASIPVFAEEEIPRLRAHSHLRSGYGAGIHDCVGPLRTWCQPLAKGECFD